MLVNTVDDAVKESEVVAKPAEEEIELEEVADDESEVLSVASEEMEEDMDAHLASHPEGPRADDLLSWWYAGLHPVIRDVNDELGGNETSLIVVEALLLRLCCGREFAAEFLTKPRFVEVFYVIENMLYRLNTIGFCNYELVFFDCLKATLLRQHPLLWALRNAFLMHSIAHQFPCRRFQDWYSAEYDLFIRQRQPFTMLLEDGSHLNTQMCEIASTTTELECPIEFSALHLLMLNTVGRRISACYLYELDIVTRRIKAWSIEHNAYSESLERGVKEKVLAAEQELVDSMEGLVELAENDKCATVVEQITASPQTFRQQMIVNVAADLITDVADSESAWTVLWFKAALLQDLLLDTLSAEQRRCALQPFESISYTTTNEFFGLYLEYYLTEIAKAPEGAAQTASQPAMTPESLAPVPCMTQLGGTTLKEINKQAIDLFDELTIRRVLFAMCDEWSQNEGNALSADVLAIPEEDAARLDALWRSHFNAAFFPVEFNEHLMEELDDAFHQLNYAVVDTSGEPDLPTVIRLKPNPFVNKVVGNTTGIVPGVMDDEVTKDGTRMVQSFSEALLGTSKWSVEADGDSSLMGFKIVGRSEYDFADEMAKQEQEQDTTANPEWLKKYDPEKREQVLKKYLRKKDQQASAYCKQLNKFMGGLDKLHRPIVLTGGHCGSDHCWFRELECVEDSDSSPSAPEAKPEKPAKKTAGKKAAEKKPEKVEKLGSKAAAIIEKNRAAKAEKLKKKDTEGYEQLRLQVTHCFRRKAENPLVFYNAFLELLVGTRNALDTTVLEDFPAVNKAIALPETRLEMLTSMAEMLLDPLENSWRLKTIIAKNLEPGMLKVIGVIFRFVQVTSQKYLRIMLPSQIKMFQTLLLTLGFRSSANALFNDWVKMQWQKSAEPEDSGKTSKADHKTSKASKPGAKAAADSSKKKTAVAKAPVEDTRERERFMKKMESYRVKRVSRPFDFEIRPEIEMTFQLKYLGADMTRSLGSVQDPRVPFTPDSWQKKLLDAVDNRESALVVAPTSSGKTFICYYAMDQALRFDNEACVVFVSPTRALALQVELEVMARFGSKTYSSSSKYSLVGHLYENRVHNWDRCQVLITVPSRFEAVLRSKDPELQAWKRKLKYVIMDEIHCIGDEKLGKDCESIIQLLPCPFMALSATIGNETSFANWLSAAQSFPGAKPMRFIKYDERYADLKTYYYDSSIAGIFDFNPLLCVSYDRALSGTLTGDFYLVPTECLKVFQIVSEVLSTDVKPALEQVDRAAANLKVIDAFVTQWNPEVYFQGTQAITKRQYRYYITSIVQTLEVLIQEGVINREAYQKILDKVADQKQLGNTKVEPWYKVKSEEEMAKKDAVHAVTLNDVLETSGSETGCFNDPAAFLSFIRELEGKRLLPALVFNFNRAVASRLFYKLVNKLIDDHHAKFYGTPELAAKTRAINKQRQDEYKQMLANREMAEKWKTLSKQQREEQGIDEQLLIELTGPPPPAPIDIADEHDPDVFLCDKRTFTTHQEDYNEVIRFCRIDHFVRTGRVPAILAEALRRGIGFYHDALHREYRRAVEFLFRQRYLRIVVSDIALSMGVNMPCKTTIFAGDSSTLTPLLFRQTAGRAGRRGFDSLGNIVFWNFPFKKIRRVLCSVLPVLSGAHPIRPSTVLKTIQLSESVEQSTSRCLKMLNVSLYELGSAEPRDALKENYQISFRFTVDLLMRLGLLNIKAETLPFAALADSMLKNEEGNLILPIALLMNGLHPDYVPGDSYKDNLLLWLAHAVEKRRFTYSMVKRFELATKSAKYQEVLFPHRSAITTALGERGSEWSPLLPPLREHEKAILQRLDEISLTNSVARFQALSLAKMARLPPNVDLLMPMSEVDFSGREGAALPLEDYLKKSAMAPQATLLQSPFFSGCADSALQTPEQVCSRMRPQVYAEICSVPKGMGHVAQVHSLATGETEEVPLVNSFLPELLAQKSLRMMIQHNQIPPSDAYYVALGAKESVDQLFAALKTMGVKKADAQDADYFCVLEAAMAQVTDELDAVYKRIKS